MTHDFTAVIQTYWIAHGPDALHYGVLEPDQPMQTGLPYLETYPSQRAQDCRIADLRRDYAPAVAEWLETLRLRDPVAKLADYRWRRETGGMTLPDGTEILTTREAQAQITSTMLSMNVGIVEPPVRWKAQSGWVSLGLAELVFVAAAVALHVKVCFQAEEEVQAQLAGDPGLDVVSSFDATYAQLITAAMAEMS